MAGLDLPRYLIYSINIMVMYTDNLNSPVPSMYWLSQVNQGTLVRTDQLIFKIDLGKTKYN